MKRIETLMNLVRVLSWKDGCVWKTKILGERWIPVGLSAVEQNAIAETMGGNFFCSISTKRMVELNHMNVRTVNVEESRRDGRAG